MGGGGGGGVKSKHNCALYCIPAKLIAVLFFDVPVVGILYMTNTVVLALLPLVMSVVSILRIS